MSKATKKLPSKTISIVVPIYNEVENLILLHQALQQATKGLDYLFEFVLVDDGSADGSAKAMRALARKDQRVKVLAFSRNFGKEAATSAGLRAANGSAVMLMDADLQHPPSLLHEFVRKWEQGAEVVVGIKHYSKQISWFKRFMSAWYYRILGKISHTSITPHATDYRLLDRQVVDAVNQLTERNRMLRGLIDWLGFERDYVEFEAPPRQFGEASYSLKKLIDLAFNSFTSYSLVPLRLAGYFGLIILCTAGPLGVIVFIEKYVLHDPFGWSVSGTASLAIILVFMVGIVLVSLGLIALYIAHIHAEVTNRPLYVLRSDNQPDTTEPQGE